MLNEETIIPLHKQRSICVNPLKPSGQALFLYLLSNPHTTSIPGLYRAGAGAMAEELAWSLLGFQRALKEIVAQGLVKADLKKLGSALG